ncbi:MAG: prepilin-type N-terminal cleavage/methylation domain-containing protein [Candidatus Omnitrophica bacterium]|nr:prepilin-type N-terminal cleavage/methylation domain-containing protein [Candidatus Omnitrophota bacterium]
MRGFTLLEVLISIVIITSGIVILLEIIPVVMQGSANIENLVTATTLSRDLMDEILSKGFDDPDTGAAFGLEESAPRSNFDDVDDYDGLSEDPPQDVSGADYDGTGAMPDYSRFTRAVTVENVPENDFNAASPSADGTTDAKRIIVTVSWPDKAGTAQVELRSVASEYHPDPR